MDVVENDKAYVLSVELAGVHETRSASLPEAVDDEASEARFQT